MDAFEYIVSRAFEGRGYWTRVGFKVDLDLGTRRQLGNPNMPRPEIDVLAYNPSKKRLLLIECKSYLDNPGVGIGAFNNPHSKEGRRFKLFNNPPLFVAVKRQILKQLGADGMIDDKKQAVQLCLVAGKIRVRDKEKIKTHFKNRKWKFVEPAELVSDLRNFATRGYENDVATIAVKLLERNLPSV